MKKLFVVAVLSSGIFGINAYAIDEMKPVVHCREAINAVEIGTEVFIVQGGIAGITQATITEQSFAGLRTTGTYLVQAHHDASGAIYGGNGFRLMIVPPAVGQGIYQGGLKAVVNGRPMAKRVNCIFHR